MEIIAIENTGSEDAASPYSGGKTAEQPVNGECTNGMIIDGLQSESNNIDRQLQDVQACEAINGQYISIPKMKYDAQPTPDFDPKPCNCPVGPVSQPPFYNQLGSGPNLEHLRASLEERFELEGEALRIERVVYTCKEGKNREGCPVAKWVLRRKDATEKVLVIVRERAQHFCEDRVIVISIVVWEGVETNKSSYLYRRLTSLLSEHATMVTRRCGSNETKDCCCQGDNPETCGASFSFGCSWSMFYNGCKFGNSVSPRKFRIQDTEKENEVEHLLENLATEFGPKCRMFAPKAYENMTYYEPSAAQCRIGHGEGRPFSGMTCCLDFCAHSHKDLHNMNNGTTMVLTLLKKDSTQPNDSADDGGYQIDSNPGNDEELDEQLHVLPFYQLLDENDNICETNYVMPKHTLKSRTKPRSESSKKLKGKKRKHKNSLEKLKNEKRLKMSIGLDSTEERPSEYSLKHSAKKELFPTFDFPFINGNTTGFGDSLLAPQERSLNGGHEDKMEGVENGFTNLQEISYIDEIKIPSIFSHSLKGFSNFLKKSLTADDRIPIRPRLKHVNDFQPIMFRQDLQNFQCSQEGEGERKTSSSGNCRNDHDLRNRLGFDRICDNKLFPFVMQEQTSNEQRAFGNLSEMPDVNDSNFQAPDTCHEVDYDAFVTNDMGGVAIALTHGSVLIECAKKEVHATTPLKNPKRQNPTRLSIIFYQHKQLNLPNHGYEKNKIKTIERQRKQMAEKLKSSLVTNQNGVTAQLTDLELLAETAFTESIRENDGNVQNSQFKDQLIGRKNESKPKDSSVFPPTFNGMNTIDLARPLGLSHLLSGPLPVVSSQFQGNTIFGLAENKIRSHERSKQWEMGNAFHHVVQQQQEQQVKPQEQQNQPQECPQQRQSNDLYSQQKQEQRIFHQHQQLQNDHHNQQQQQQKQQQQNQEHQKPKQDQKIFNQQLQQQIDQHEYHSQQQPLQQQLNQHHEHQKQQQQRFLSQQQLLKSHQNQEQQTAYHQQQTAYHPQQKLQQFQEQNNQNSSYHQQQQNLHDQQQQSNFHKQSQEQSHQQQQKRYNDQHNPHLPQHHQLKQNQQIYHNQQDQQQQQQQQQNQNHHKQQQQQSHHLQQQYNSYFHQHYPQQHHNMQEQQRKYYNGQQQNHQQQQQNPHEDQQQKYYEQPQRPHQQHENQRSQHHYFLQREDDKKHRDDASFSSPFHNQTKASTPVTHFNRFSPHVPVQSRNSDKSDNTNIEPRDLQNDSTRMKQDLFKSCFSVDSLLRLEDTKGFISGKDNFSSRLDLQSSLSDFRAERKFNPKFQDSKSPGMLQDRLNDGSVFELMRCGETEGSPINNSHFHQNETVYTTKSMRNAALNSKIREDSLTNARMHRESNVHFNESLFRPGVEKSLKEKEARIASHHEWMKTKNQDGFPPCFENNFRINSDAIKGSYTSTPTSRIHPREEMSSNYLTERIELAQNDALKMAYSAGYEQNRTIERVSGSLYKINDLLGGAFKRAEGSYKSSVRSDSVLDGPYKGSDSSNKLPDHSDIVSVKNYKRPNGYYKGIDGSFERSNGMDVETNGFYNRQNDIQNGLNSMFLTNRVSNETSPNGFARRQVSNHVGVSKLFNDVSHIESNGIHAHTTSAPIGSPATTNRLNCIYNGRNFTERSPDATRDRSYSSFSFSNSAPNIGNDFKTGTPYYDSQMHTLTGIPNMHGFKSYNQGPFSRISNSYWY